MQATLKRALLLFALVFLSARVDAHLNHVQFATVDEVDGALRVRYRMSADMFMSNLEVEIKSGRLGESIKQRPLDEIIRQYFKSHLAIETGGAAQNARTVTFFRDEKTGDWVADFVFDAPAPGAETTLLCDAFLENNPRTQTLARIDWRGEKTMFHFRKGYEHYALGSSLHPAVQETQARDGDGEQFLDGLAHAFKSYELLAAGALVCLVLGLALRKWKFAVPLLALAACVLLSRDECERESLQHAAGFAVGWLAVALTGFAFSVGRPARPSSVGSAVTQ